MTSPIPLRIAELRAIVQLARQATSGVTGIVEGVHQSVWTRLGFPAAQPGRTDGITGLVYRSIEAITHGVGGAADGLLGALDRFGSPGSIEPVSWRREALLAVLNGVVGDHLAASGNPLATPMSLRQRGEPLNWASAPPPTGKLLLLVHGLCMNDLQWQTEHDGQPVDHGETLARELGYTPVYLRYNSGRHIAHNGRELSAQLDELVASWPVPVEHLSVLAHSMGGLVARSAVHHAEMDEARWLAHLRHLLFLGTPHHGAPLERAGNWIDAALASTPYSAPLARLGQIRSAGITDLRYGHLTDLDHHPDRFNRLGDQRNVVPLPSGVDCFNLAATTAGVRSKLAERLLGDGLVPLYSALGQHDDPARSLPLPESSQWIAYRTNHMELLRRPEVAAQLLEWLRSH